MSGKEKNGDGSVPFFLAVVFSLAAAGAQPPGMASILIHNAVIYTADPQQPTAEAIAIRGERIALVGSNEQVMQMRGPYTRVIDAQGGAVIPGLHDAHGHFTGLGEKLDRLDLRGTTSFDQIVRMVRARAATARPGEWILGRNWDQNDWAVMEFPTHQALDAAAPQNPVYLTRVDGHAALANAKALALGGVAPAAKDPDGGRIVRDAGGRPTGVLIDRAMELVAGKIPPESEEQAAEQIVLADRECRRLGLTMVHDAGAAPHTVERYRRAVASGALQTRLYVMLRGTPAELQPLLARGPVLDPAQRLVVRAVKIVADGALGSRGAALLEDYSDDRGNRGLLVTPPQAVYEQTLAASRAGFQTCIHAIGDRANRGALDTFERVQKEVPGARAQRLRVEHAQTLDASDIPRFVALDVIASMQATHCTSDMPWAPARLGAARIAEGAYVWRKLLARGTVIANGSDFPVEEANPLLGFYAAVTRQDPAGRPAAGWAPDQRLTRQEALTSFTLSAAYAAHAEKDLGSLTAGKLADVVMLSKDVMTVAPRQILDAKVLRTIIGGRIVHE